MKSQTDMLFFVRKKLVKSKKDHVKFKASGLNYGKYEDQTLRDIYEENGEDFSAFQKEYGYNFSKEYLYQMCGKFN